MVSASVMIVAIILFSISGHIMIREWTRSTLLQSARVDYSRTALRFGKFYKVAASFLLMVLMLIIMIDAAKSVFLNEFPF